MIKSPSHLLSLLYGPQKNTGNKSDQGPAQIILPDGRKIVLDLDGLGKAQEEEETPGGDDPQKPKIEAQS